MYGFFSVHNVNVSDLTLLPVLFQVTPVLISSNHVSADETDDNNPDRVLVPMMWGMIPFWHTVSEHFVALFAKHLTS